MEPDFTSARFRGREEASAAPLPQSAIGLRLGAYPVIVAPIALKSIEQMQASLRVLHNQMVIARSVYARRRSHQSHIMLCVTATNPHADWRRIMDLAERDEAVCRKVVGCQRERN